MFLFLYFCLIVIEIKGSFPEHRLEAFVTRPDLQWRVNYILFLIESWELPNIDRIKIEEE